MVMSYCTINSWGGNESDKGLELLEKGRGKGGGNAWGISLVTAQSAAVISPLIHSDPSKCRRNFPSAQAGEKI